MLKKEEPEIRSKEKESDNLTPPFEDRLVIKLSGPGKFIQQHIMLLKRIYPPSMLNFSPLIKNRDGTDSYHCYINVLMEAKEQ